MGPSFNNCKTLLSICSLLDDPNPDIRSSPGMSPEIADLLRTNPEEFKRTAKEWTQRYATSE